jgi:MFS transporter, PAT family, beta-lactamase induction signal transducer AmpG
VLPNPLASRPGRLAAFFFLYLTETLTLGFAGTALAFQLRQQGMGLAQIGAFTGSLFLVWSLKWLVAPAVDGWRSRRFGHRRAWILGCQLAMVLTLAGLAGLALPAQMPLFSALLLVHILFAATQDVAIDALACTTLPAQERGLANGLMFAGSSVGMALGGSGVLLLMPHIGLSACLLLLAATVLAVSVCVVLPLREPPVALSENPPRALAALRAYAIEAFRAFVSTRAAWAGVAFCLLPAGAMALGGALRTSLAVELGLSAGEAAGLDLASLLLRAAGMVLGGWLADRIGRARVVCIGLPLMSVAVLLLAGALQLNGHVWPKPTAGAATALLALWVTALVWELFHGMAYAARVALMMDLTRAHVAGTQFTASMSMMAFALAYTPMLLGLAVEAIGYPLTLLIDVVLGLLVLLVLPLLTPSSRDADLQAPARRARALAAWLALLCLAFVLFSLWGAATGKAQALLGLFFTFGLVLAAVVLAVGGALAGPGMAKRCAPWVAAALQGVFLLRFAPPAAWVDACRVTAALAGAGLLAWLSRQAWRGLTDDATPA